MTKLLSERIRDLHLRPNAPYPSEELRKREKEKAEIDAILKWRKSQELHLVTKDDHGTT